MPTLLATTAAQLGLTAANNAMGAWMQNKQNEKQNQRAIDFYNMQRQDNLEDWERDSAYNAPARMSQRLQEGGFSPHLVNGQAALVSSPQTKSANISAPASAYQVRQSPIDVQQLVQGMEQVKLLRAQREKVEAERDGIIIENNANSSDSGYDGTVINKRKQLEIEQIMSALRKLTADQENTVESTENLRVARKGMVTNNAIAEIERIFRSPALQGKNELIQKQVQSMLLKNYKDEVENKYVPRNAASNAAKLGYETKLRKQEAELLDTLPPSVRYFLERMGGSGMATILLRALMGK